MYKDKKFRIRNTDEIIKDINKGRSLYKRIDRVFLADGDALIIKTTELLEILKHIKIVFPECERIGIYASPKSIATKSIEELELLYKAGLGIAYLGLESGLDKILNSINKGATAKEIVELSKKIKESKILLSVTLISGLGGKELWEEHAIESAKVISEIKPDYLGLLTLMLEYGTKLYDDVENGLFKILTPKEIAIETLELLKNLDSEACIFRSNHASNYLSLKGTLNKDKDKMIDILREAIKTEKAYKSEHLRGL